MTSVLHHNPEAGVEIRMERPEQFAAENLPALNLLDQHFPERFNLTKIVRQDELSQSRSSPESVRWLSTPEMKAEYVYIGDIDILVLEEVAPAHLAHMRRTGLPYSNIQRPNQPRLTGLHFTRWDAYYPQVELDDTTPPEKDEWLLYWLISQKGVGLPDPRDDFHPTHGYHMSIVRNTANSGAGTVPSWRIRNPSFLAAYLTFSTTSLWQQLAPLFDRRYRQLLSMLDIALAQRFPQETSERKPAPGTLPRDWW